MLNQSVLTQPTASTLLPGNGSISNSQEKPKKSGKLDYFDRRSKRFSTSFSGKAEHLNYQSQRLTTPDIHSSSINKQYATQSAFLKKVGFDQEKNINKTVVKVNSLIVQESLDKEKTIYKDLFKETKVHHQSLNIRYVEKWINETLEDCLQLKIPGSLSKPIHKHQLARHGLDRLTLTNRGVHNQNVNRVYRSLFVFTAGFYEIITECTQFLGDDRYLVFGQIWKAFQILLEFSFQSEYKLVTQQMAIMHQTELEELESRHRELTTKFEANEADMKDRLKILTGLVDSLEEGKARSDKERNQYMQEAQKNQMKHEEEVQLRLFFESKLNTLHHLNRELTSKFKHMKMNHAEESIKNKDLQKKLEELQTEIAQLKTSNTSLEDKLFNANLKVERAYEDREKTQNELDETEGNLYQANMTISLLQARLKGVANQNTKLEMDQSSIDNLVKSQNQMHSNEVAMVKNLQSKNEDKDSLIQQLKDKNQRVRNKLRLFKIDKIEYETRIKELKERIDSLWKENKTVKDQLNHSRDEGILHQVENEQLKVQLEMMKADSEILMDNATLQTAVRHDFEHRLKTQIDQTEKLFSEREDMLSQVKSSQKQVLMAEMRTKDAEQEREDLEHSYKALESKYDSLKEKYDNTTIHLRLLVENEKDSRDTWKDKYSEEISNKSYQKKTIFTLQNEVQEFKINSQKLSTLLLEAERLRNLYKSQRDEAQDKLQHLELQLQNIERELNTKRTILDLYDEEKRNEMRGMKAQIKKHDFLTNQYQMQIEDTSSELMRVLEKSRIFLQNQGNSSKELKETQGQLTNLRHEINEVVKEKIELQDRIDQMTLDIQKTNDVVKDREEKLEKVQEKLEAKFNEAEQLSKDLRAQKLKMAVLLQQNKELNANKEQFTRKFEIREKGVNTMTLTEVAWTQTEGLEYSNRRNDHVQRLGSQGEKNSIYHEDQDTNFSGVSSAIPGELSQMKPIFDTSVNQAYQKQSMTQPKSQLQRTKTTQNQYQQQQHQFRPYTSNQSDLIVEENYTTSFGDGNRAIISSTGFREKIPKETGTQKFDYQKKEVVTSTNANTSKDKRGGTSYKPSRNINVMPSSQSISKRQPDKQSEQIGKESRAFTNHKKNQSLNSAVVDMSYSDVKPVSQSQMTKITENNIYKANEQRSTSSITQTNLTASYQQTQDEGRIKSLINGLMGCSGGKAASSRGIKLLPNSLNGLDEDAKRTVSEFPYVNPRLSEIDYKKIIELGEPWADTYFRPEKTSIYDPFMTKTPRHQEWDSYTWKRPRDVYGKDNYDLFKTITPSDIKQGACGDCYYLSAISSLAEQPDRVKRIFLTQEVNKAGCYAMIFYIGGEKRTIVVDDLFPYNEAKKNWAFSRPDKDRDIWVLLLEKAWAKIHGNYQRIEAGTNGEALPALTGAPADFTYHAEIKNKEDLWRSIQDADKKNYIIGTAVSSQKQGKNSTEMTGIGLVDAHAYSLISVFQLEHLGQQLRLLKIRNPWGFKEWTGDWSDKSTLWTEDLRVKLSWVNADDGVFFISFEDYVKFFYITTICKDIWENDVSSMPDEHEPYKYCAQRFILEKNYDAPISILLSQIHGRFVDKLMNGSYKYAPLQMMLAKISKGEDQVASKKQGGEELVFLDGTYIAYQHTHIELDRITAGEYILLFKAEWNSQANLVRRLVVNLYAPDPIKINRVHVSKFPMSIYSMLEESLTQRIYLGKKYETPYI